MLAPTGRDSVPGWSPRSSPQSCSWFPFAQDVEVTIEYNECFLMCHRFAKHAVEVMGATEEVASGLFVTCMNTYCGGMGEGTS